MIFFEFSENFDKKCMFKVNNKSLRVRTLAIALLYHTGYGETRPAILKYFTDEPIFSSLETRKSRLDIAIKIPEHYAENYIDNLTTLIKSFVFVCLLKQELPKPAKLLILQGFRSKARVRTKLFGPCRERCIWSS